MKEKKNKIIMGVILGLLVIGVLLNFGNIRYAYLKNTLLKKGVITEKLLDEIYTKEGEYELIKISRELDKKSFLKSGDAILKYIYEKYLSKNSDEQNIEIFLTEVDAVQHEELYKGAFKNIVVSKIESIKKIEDLQERMNREKELFIYLQSIKYFDEIVNEVKTIINDKTEKMEMELIYIELITIYKYNNKPEKMKEIGEIMKVKLGEDSIKHKKIK